MKITNAKRLVKTFFEDWKEFSLSVALGRFVRDFSVIPWPKRRAFYENRVYEYLEKNYGRIIAEYQGEPEEPTKGIIIWVMWWQGVETMPDLVKACYNRLLKVAQHEVILITATNYKDYIEIPNYILEKHARGIISTTHLSDIIRVALLKKYGGLWMDATIYADHIPEEVFKGSFYTLHAPGMFPDFISRGSWSPFLLLVNSTHFRLFGVMEQLFGEYWLNHNKLIDYLLVDYFLKLTFSKNKPIHDLLESLPINNEYYNLNLSINAPYDEIIAKFMLAKSPLQKLSYKNVVVQKGDQDVETNYSRLISGRFLDE